MLMEEMTTNEIEEGLKVTQTVIIPIGVIEAHGTSFTCHHRYI